MSAQRDLWLCRACGRTDSDSGVGMCSVYCWCGACSWFLIPARVLIQLRNGIPADVVRDAFAIGRKGWR